MGIIAGIVSKIAGEQAANIVTSVTDAADRFITTPQEKEQFKLEVEKEINRHLESIVEEQTKQEEILMKDMDSARNREIQISTSEKAPFFNKVIQPLLALLILGSCFIMWYTILFKDIPEGKSTIVSLITGSLTTLAMGVVSYYFGSSMSSKQKQDQLDKIQNLKS